MKNCAQLVYNEFYIFIMWGVVLEINNEIEKNQTLRNSERKSTAMSRKKQVEKNKKLYIGNRKTKAD